MSKSENNRYLLFAVISKDNKHAGIKMQKLRKTLD